MIKIKILINNSTTRKHGFFLVEMLLKMWQSALKSPTSHTHFLDRSKLVGIVYRHEAVHEDRRELVDRAKAALVVIPLAILKGIERVNA